MLLWNIDLWIWFRSATSSRKCNHMGKTAITDYWPGP